MLRTDISIPDWFTGLTAQKWDELPDSYYKSREVVGGSIVFGPLPDREHSKAVSLLWLALRRPAARFGAETNQRIDSVPWADLRFEDDPLHHRRPDVLVTRCADHEVLPTPSDALLVVEVVAPNSRVTDKIDKLGEYATAGVPHYWIFETRNGAISSVTWYALPSDDKRYEVRACWTPAETPEGIRASEPFPVRIAWDELAF